MQALRRFLFIALVLTFVVTLTARVAFAAGGSEPPPDASTAVQLILLTLLGLIAPAFDEIANKALGGLEDWRALWAAMILSLVLAVFAGLISGTLALNASPSDPAAFLKELLAGGGYVFMLSQPVFWKLVKKPAAPVSGITTTTSASTVERI